jgi:uncharacterized protein YceK
MKKLAISLVTIFALSGCGLFDSNTSGGGSESAGASSEVKAAIAAAEAAIKKSASVGGEWRDAEKKILKKAKAAASKGDNETALKLAKRAKFEGEMGYQQAMEQKDAKPWLF